MRGGQLIREARLRAGLSQAALARRLGTAQPAIARWEAGGASPALETVLRAVRAAGFDLSVRMVPRDDHDRELAAEAAALPRVERMEEFLRALELAEDLRAAGIRARRRGRP